MSDHDRHDDLQRAEIVIHHHVHIHVDDKLIDLVFDIRNLKEKVTHIMVTQAEQAQILRDVLAQQQKTVKIMHHKSWLMLLQPSRLKHRSWMTQSLMRRLRRLPKPELAGGMKSPAF